MELQTACALLYNIMVYLQKREYYVRIAFSGIANAKSIGYLTGCLIITRGIISISFVIIANSRIYISAYNRFHEISMYNLKKKFVLMGKLIITRNLSVHIVVSCIIREKIKNRLNNH